MNPLRIFKKESINLEKLIDNVSKGIDKLSFTKQERANFNTKMADKMAEFYANTLSENTLRSKTRRFIAKFVIVNVFMMIWLCVVLSLLEISIDNILEIVKTFSLSVVFITVIMFFFGGYYMKNISINKKNDKV